ncbi:conserved hypothetical protein [Verticillium alfalfae VaMs.102]|uniref:Heme haloperoxidase family profile domain-containing protein n=1 Tax=Verticillium alfalfae (strain VaMs.102 / ATCC MYA-4576 / FGSC 10136) TaxID=526221 RepID=C9SXP4_VERA1|nr:conserved hypothetical protein [Verticillium alfalfae VaMs.102]EEY23434.1 conserved hypothetical protein [Verticillium alfalfae VaMs.102]
MKFTIFSSSLAVAMVHAYPPSYMASLSKRAEPGVWEPAGPDDFRGPCPMMNTLANHNFLPHDDRTLQKRMPSSRSAKVSASTVTLQPSCGSRPYISTPTPNATFFTLDQLNVHNILEHDGSLTRTDDFLGSNHIFNQTVFDETRSYWTGDVIDATMLANSKIARQVTSRATNPTYTFTSTMEQFSIGEVAAPIIGLGDMEAATVSRAFVEYWIQNERLPSELGWVKKQVPVTLQNILAVNEIITNATSLITTGEPVPGPPRPVDGYRPNLHAGTF